MVSGIAGEFGQHSEPVAGAFDDCFEEGWLRGRHRAGGARGPRRAKSDASGWSPVRALLRGEPRARPGSPPADDRPLGSCKDEHIAERSSECRHLQDMALHADVNRYFDSVWSRTLPSLATLPSAPTHRIFARQSCSEAGLPRRKEPRSHSTCATVWG